MRHKRDIPQLVLVNRPTLSSLLDEVEAKLLGQRINLRLVRVIKPRRAEIDRRRTIVLGWDGEDLAADTVHGLEDDITEPRMVNFCRCTETAEAGADDDDLDFLGGHFNGGWKDACC